MNIVLVRPKPHNDSIGLQKFMICEPLELEYLSSYLEEFGHKVEIIDMILEPPKKLLELIATYKPGIVGFTSYMPHVNIVKGYARIIKQYDPAILTVVGGVHAEVNSEDFLDKDIDFVVKVNGLRTFKEIVDAVLRGDNQEIIKNSVSGVFSKLRTDYPIEEMWNYPFPDRDKTQKYRKSYNYIFHNNCATIKTSFGCPYNCEFCYCVEIAQHRYIERDIRNVVEEIQTIKQKNIFIVDDNFLVSIPRIKEFCRLMQEFGIKKNFIVFGRADFIVSHPDIIKQLQDHGLKAIFVGIESFKEEELANFGKKTSVKINSQAIHLLDRLGIECYSGIMVGADWDKKDFDYLISFLKQFKRPLLNIQPVTPIPGTMLYEKRGHEVIEPRQKYHLWDMAHILLEPTKMSRRNYYFQIMRTYYATATGPGAHVYVLRKYGLRVFLRTGIGVAYVTWQYLKLVIKG